MTRSALLLRSIPVLFVVGVTLSGCATTAGNVGLAALAGTAYGARAPTTELEQIYYLGVFDPQDQLPPTVYRIRVHGQASFLSGTKFASGWVPADVLDSLGTSISFDKESSRVKIEKADDDFKTFKTGRRLMQFGPEGFREAPANHRLVILMSSSPETFFSAIDQSLGIIAQSTQGQSGAALDRSLFELLVTTRNERTALEDLSRDARADAATGATQ